MATPWWQSKKASKVFLIGVLLTFFTLPTLSYAEIIRSFESTVVINHDGSLDVAEKILYDFEGAQRHGIYRELPYLYTLPYYMFRSIGISGISVEDENGRPYSFTLSSSNGYKIAKIGDPNTLITGPHLYVINYKVKRVFNTFDGYDELYWNVTGNGWNVPIESASVRIIFPDTLPTDKFSVSCYSGAYGGKNTCEMPENIDKTTSSILLASTEPLSLGQGLTFAIAFMDGKFAMSGLGKSVWFLFDNIGLFFGLLIFLGSFFWLWRKWKKSGDDPKGSNVIVPQYEEPDGITPLEAAVIVNEKISNDNISAELIYLAVKGYLRIERKESRKVLGLIKDDDYRLVRLKTDYSILGEADKRLLKGVFGDKDSVWLSHLKNSFFLTLKDIKELADNSVVSKGQYTENPEKKRRSYFSSGAFLLAGSVFLLSFMGMYVVWLSLGLFTTGLLVITFGFIMPKKTEIGVRTKEELFGLREYLQIAEKDRINFHNAPQKNPELFDKLLPFAMIFGVERAWAKEFEDIYTTPPSWYSGNVGGNGFHLSGFSNDLGSFSSFANSALSSPPASSSGGSGSFGGGFSGGGFGGGGGGSW